MLKSFENFDVVVVGGGPGGSTVATLIAMAGHRVLLLERELFPRHQIGESLLPATVHGICGLLGLTDELARAGFPRKRGGTFLWGRESMPWTFTFARNPNAPGGFAYQVERARFDKLLLDNARRRGVDVRERHRVDEILLHEGRAVSVRFTDDAGVQGMVHSRFVVDASGHRSRQHNRHVGERIHSKFFRNVALYGYFENGKRLPAPNEGNIFCCAFGDGWFWYIPLSDNLTSVGVVVSADAAHILRRGHEEAFAQFVGACPPIAEHLANATRVSEGMYGGYRVRKDYSYCNSAFSIPGLVLVGDAACFVDPVFSSGVHLATYSALLAARSINTALRGTLDEMTCFREYERRYRREFGNFYEFLLSFYDMHKDPTSYFWTARKILRTEESANEAFVRLVAGLSADDEPLFSSSEFFQTRAGLGDWFQEVVEIRGEGGAYAAKRSEATPFEPEFLQDLTREMSQVQLQALYRDSRPQERPRVPNGLVPSRDGLHWTVPSERR